MKIKKIFYVSLAGLLGFLISILLHVFIEVMYLRSLESQGKSPSWYKLFGDNLEALPSWIVILLTVVGIGFGIYLGFVWWRIVYIEKRHWRFKEKK